MEHDTLDDRALVARIQTGDRDAFSTLVVRYQERVLNIAFRRLGDRDAALDVAQETFLKAYRGIDRFHGESQFFTWLFRITVNETISARRKLGRHQRAVSLDQATDDAPHYVPAAPAFDPAAGLAKQDELELVQQAIGELDDELGDPLVLRDIDGRSYQEISQILQIPLGSVKSRIHRARTTLKDRLAKVTEPRPERVR